MDRAALEARMAALQAEQQAHIDQVNCLSGMLADCRYWISQLPPDPAPEPAAVVPQPPEEKPSC